ncbi:trypsin-like serine protease, typically periplasmic, containing C-terminal PDZ domain protein [Rubidibacter lacunae KORDI 51-2]|uniref:Trypsin-like serine protease, typically periplasmic, containing C-terminal PDZ domain protein n=1 Tax=Rubidibacter lacunae KORDI 51-2 TaxID=582515 RepID=U5DRG2_9CHRO|nr:HhoA/HhoB/HtrA family serine endopeptidase [Rubidibacter lacunae]ERN42285.1 trypsin-like serine protease, typically periplasmic, containing C-terminal PDZ domain protein [Rubidibacter lacunae KORDI 51-2]
MSIIARLQHIIVVGIAVAILTFGIEGNARADAIALNSSTLPVGSSFVSDAVEAVGPAVVRIDTEATIEQSNPFAEDPFFRQFFGEDFFPALPQERTVRGQGSGFIVDRSGIVLTNAHVVSNTDRVVVTLRDGRRYEGTVCGSDPLTDLAVVDIDDGDDLPVVALGDSDLVRVGDWAIAVGNPLGLDNTVTLGIISTLERSSAKVGIPDKRLDFLQTDAAINPGNSGGPLLNGRGEVIGINTAIRADANGIGFAIPVNKAKEIYPTLARGEQIDHPYIGIRLMTLTPAYAARVNSDPNSTIVLPETNGVLVLAVERGTPSEQAGLRRGDAIVAVDGEAIASAEQLQRQIENSKIGRAIELKVLRGEMERLLSVKPMQMPMS